MALSLVIVSNITVAAQTFINWNFLAITSLKRKREKRRFFDLRITLMSHYGNEFLKQVLHMRFTLDGIVPRYRSTIKSSFLGTAGITFSGT